MASSSEGAREIEAAKKRLAAAKARASADDKALKFAREAEESARKMAEMAQKNAVAAKKHRGDIESQLQGSHEEVKEAEKYLKGAEDRWEVVAIDDSDADESGEGGSRKKQKTSSGDHVDEITVEGCGVPGANGVYKATSISGRAVYVKEGELEGKAGKFIIFSIVSSNLRFWYVSHQEYHGAIAIGRKLVYMKPVDKTDEMPPKEGWECQRAGVYPAPTLKW